MKLFLLVYLLAIPGILLSQALPITLDGEFDDWEDASVLFDITQTDQSPDNLHVTRMWGANDDDFLFIRIEFDREITLLDNNPVILFLDTDNDITTGYDPDIIGAELQWEFGDRRGTFYNEGGSHWIRFHNIRLRTAPTVTSTDFEIALGCNALPDGSTSLFQSDTVNIRIRFDEQGNDAYASGTYIFDPVPVPAPDPIPLERMSDDDLRILAFNAWDDKVFEEEFTDQYYRILNTLQPDIIAFQEIWQHSAGETSERVADLYSLDESSQWYAVKEDTGNVTVSRFPIMDSWQILVWDDDEGWSDRHRLTVSLINMQEEYNTNLLFVNVHLRCCAGGEENRWKEITALTNFIDNAREPGGSLHIDEDTPIILAGDFNLVGSSEQLAAIEDDITDWDGRGIERVRARQTGKRMHYTWRNDNSGFSPGKLDYIFYTSSVLSLKNTYTLQVEEMSPEQRDKYGLHYGDTRVASDHLPHVADFSVKAATAIKDDTTIESFYLGKNYPNPFNARTTVTFSIPETSDVSIILHDLLGRNVDTLFDGRKVAGSYSIDFDASVLASGVYYYTMTAGDFIKTRKMILLQ